MARTGCAHWPGGLAHSYADTLAVIARCVTACRRACAAAFGLTCGAFALLHAATPAASLPTVHALACSLTVCGAVAAPVAVPLPVAAAAALAHTHALPHVLVCPHFLICGLACIRHCAHAATCRVGSLAAASAHTAPCAGTITLRPCVIETRHVILLRLPLLTYVINRSMNVYDICQ